MMTNDEIREDLTQARGIFRDYHTSAVPTGLLDALCDHIETLLARQADLAKHAHPYVLATDYAALEAERDEWKRRCEAMLVELDPGEKPKEPYPSATSYEHQLASIKRKLWTQHERLHAAALAIAEGRDNG